jgi:ABC-2 type transport system ATP-binding protein
MTPAIELDQLTVQLGGRPILKSLSAGLGGRTLGLLGPNGAGKTTLLHTLLGFFPASSGTARVFGHDVRTETAAIRRVVGYMPENDSFIAEMSAVRYVRLMAELSGLPAEQALERAHEALFWVGLGEARYRPLGSYSLGMKQQAKLAQAIVHGPRLLILDEPTNGLDPPHRVRMLELIRDIRERGDMVLILSSHLLRDVEESCEEVLVLKDGAIAAQCDLAAERRAQQRLVEVEVAGERQAFVDAVARIGCDCAAGTRQRIKVLLPEGLGVSELFRVAAERGVQLRRLEVKRTSLEEIFLAAMGEIDGRL